MRPVTRDYEEPSDMALLQEVASECWRLEAPFASCALGDPPWRMYQHLDKLKEVRVRLWLDQRNGNPLAWAWVSLPAELDFVIHPHVRRELVDHVLDWFEQDARGDEQAVWALEHERDAVAAIKRRGYVPDTGQWLEHMVRSLKEAPPEPELPEGYTLRTVRGDEDVEARVEVHRAAFAPSRVVADSYRRVMHAYPYRPELDYVVKAPDGSFAAFCLCWLDEQNRVGELEPVGTHPDHRRRGLARAACLAGLRGLREGGAETAVVYSLGGSAATGLYESIGFVSISRHVRFRPRRRKAKEGDGAPSAPLSSGDQDNDENDGEQDQAPQSRRLPSARENQYGGYRDRHEKRRASDQLHDSLASRPSGDTQDDAGVARRAVAGVEAGHDELLAVAHAGRHVDDHVAPGIDVSFAPTFRTLLRREAAGALAFRTALDAKHLSVRLDGRALAPPFAAARAALRRVRSDDSPATGAPRADAAAANPDRALRSAFGFDGAEPQLADDLALAARPAAGEDPVEQLLVRDVRGVRRRLTDPWMCRAKAAVTRTAVRQPVVQQPRVGLREDLVGLGGLAKTPGGVRLGGDVRVEAPRQVDERLPDRIAGRVTGDAEHLVVVALLLGLHGRLLVTARTLTRPVSPAPLSTQTSTATGSPRRPFSLWEMGRTGQRLAVFACAVLGLLGVWSAEAVGLDPPPLPTVTVPTTLPQVTVPTLPQLPTTAPTPPKPTVPSPKTSTPATPSVGGGSVGGGAGAQASSTSGSGASGASGAQGTTAHGTAQRGAWAGGASPEAARAGSRPARVTRARAKRGWISRKGPASRRSTTLVVRLSRAGVIEIEVVQVSPVCRSWGHLRIRGRAGLNRVHFRGRIAGRRLPPGTYRLRARAAGSEHVVVVRLVIVEKQLSRPLSAALAAGACARGSETAARTGVGQLGALQGISRSGRRSSTRTKSASAPLTEGRPGAVLGAQALGVPQQAAGTGGLPLALLTGLLLVAAMLAFVVMPAAAVPNARLASFVVDRRVELALAAGAALAVLTIAYVVVAR